MPKILVVDDDRDTCRFIAEVLAAPGREFELATETDRALRPCAHRAVRLGRLRHQPEQPGERSRRAARVQSCESKRSGFTGERIWHAGDRDRSGPRRGIRLHQQAVRHRGGQKNGSASARPGGDLAQSRKLQPSRCQSGELIGRTPAMLAVYNQIARAADSVVPGARSSARVVPGRSWWRVRCTATASGRHAHLWRSTAEPLRRRCSSRSCSATRAGHSPAPLPTRKGSSSKHTVGRCSSTRSAKHRRPPGQTVAGPGGGRSSPGRKQPPDQGRQSHRRGDQPRSWSKPAQEQQFRADLYYRLSVIVIRAAGTPGPAGRHPASHRRVPDRRRAGAQVDRSNCRPAPSMCCSRTTGPATFGSWRTPSNASSCSAGAPSLDPTISQPCCRAVRRETPAGLFEDLPSLEEVERRYIEHVLQAVGRNRTRAADVLGIDRRTLYRMAERYGIKLGDEPDK